MGERLHKCFPSIKIFDDVRNIKIAMNQIQ